MTEVYKAMQVRYSTVLYCTVLYCTVLYCTVLYCTVLYCTVLYCTVLYTTTCLNFSNFLFQKCLSSFPSPKPYFSFLTFPLFPFSSILSCLFFPPHYYYHTLLGFTMHMASSEQLPCAVCVAAHPQCRRGPHSRPWIKFRTRCRTQSVPNYDKCKIFFLSLFFCIRIFCFL
jgi:hypothetical protein